MSHPKPAPAGPRTAGNTSRGRKSATTAEGIAGQRVALAARSRSRDVSRATRAARRLEHAARADADAA
jgi:hypothetical protein